MIQSKEHAQRRAYVDLQGAAKKLAAAASAMRDCDPEDLAGIAIAQMCTGLAGSLRRLIEWMEDGDKDGPGMKIERDGLVGFRLTDIPREIYEDEPSMAVLRSEFERLISAELDMFFDEFFDERVRGTSDIGGVPVGYLSCLEKGNP